MLQAIAYGAAGLAALNLFNQRKLDDRVKGIKSHFLAGAAADTDIAVTGLKSTARVVGATAFLPSDGTAAGSVEDLSASILVKTDAVQFSVDTTGKSIQLIVVNQ